MVKRLTLLVMLTSVATSLWTEAARTEDPVSGQDVDACEPDIHRLCDAYFPNEKLVAGCLIDKRSQLSVACAEALARPRDSVDSGKTDDDKIDTGKTDADNAEAGRK